MASPCEILIDTKDLSLATHLATVASNEAWRIEDSYSRYLKNNQIHRINNAGGSMVSVDSELALLLNFADTCWNLSDGTFDITSGVLRRAWRFDGSDQIPVQSELEQLLPLVGWNKVLWDGENITIPANMEIDLGGLGKEFAVDRAAKLINAISDVPVLINYGGDLRANKAPTAEDSWQVGIENYAHSDTSAIIELASGSLATSGDARRYLLKDGVRYGHILDPRTGWPVPNAAKSITVARNQCIEAGMLATLSLLKGSGAEDFLSQQHCKHWIMR